MCSARIYLGSTSLSSLWMICLRRLINAQLASMLMNVPTGPERKCRLYWKSTALCTGELLHIYAPSLAWMLYKYRETRGANNIHLQCPHMKFYRKSFDFNGANLWNKLPRAVTSIQTKETARQALREHLLHSAPLFCRFIFCNPPCFVLCLGTCVV